MDGHEKFKRYNNLGAIIHAYNEVIIDNKATVGFLIVVVKRKL